MNFRNTYKPFFLALSFTLLISCEKEIEKNEIGDLETFENTIEVQYFKGLPVHHRFSASIEELESEDVEVALLNFYNTEKSKANKASGISETEAASALPDAAIITESAIEVYDQFPFQKNESENNIDNLLQEKLRQDKLIPQVREELRRLGYLQDVDAQIEEVIAIAESEIKKSEQDNWEMIRSDFSTLSEEEIADNIDIINEYYLLNFDYAVLENIAYNEERIVSKLKGTQKSMSQKAQEGYDSPYYDKVCTYAKVASKGYGSAVHTAAMATAALTAQSSSKEMFSDDEGGSANTREDAYRHLLFNALLANYYPSVSSKVSAVNFAKAVGDAYEECGSNPVDSKEMDYHNNAIGREIWASMTSYRKTFWGATIGLRRPSVSSLKSGIYDYVNEKSCFIVKTMNDNFPNFLLNRDQFPIEIWSKIRNTEDDKVVYFEGTIAPGILLPQEEYDYSVCDDNNLSRTKIVYKDVYIPGTDIVMDSTPLFVPNDCVITSSACYNVD